MSVSASDSTGSSSTVRRRLEGLLSGAFAGAFSKTCTAPFDRVRILCQTGACAKPSTAVRDVWTTEGWRGFFRGNLVSVMRIVPNKGVLFMCSDFYKDLFRGHSQSVSSASAGASSGAHGKGNAPGGLTGLQYVCAGSLSGATTVLATYPLDLIRGRLTGAINSATNRYTGIIQTFRVTLKEEGFRALYRGMGPSLVGAFPYEGIRFGVYDYLKHHYVPEGSPMYYNALVGAISGLTAVIALFPNDTVRRRMQMQVKLRSAPQVNTSPNAELLYKHGLDCYIQLYKRYGIGIFYRGLTANLLRVVPSGALQFASFEWGKRMLGKRNASSSAPSVPAKSA